jgi:hypothetical protein
MPTFDLSAAPVEWYPSGLALIYGPAATQIDWVGNTIKAALLGSGYLPKLDTHDFFDDITAELSAGGGYSSGGATLANKSIAYSAGRVSFVADPATWAGTLAARFAVIYKSTGVAGTSPLLGLADFQSTVNLDRIIWPGTGVLYLKRTVV